MDKFIKNLEELTYSALDLSKEWQKLNETEIKLINYCYPFDDDFQDIVVKIINWKNYLKQQMK